MSRKLSLLFVAAAALSAMGCSSVDNVFTRQATIQPDEARFDFFAERAKPQREFIGLMCHNQEVASVDFVRDLTPGDHVVYVKALLFNANRPDVPTRQAIARFDVNLEGGKRYTVNREREGYELNLWLQEAETGLRVSEIVSTTASYQGLDNVAQFNQCKEGTV